jgi:hypothetical protein
MAFPGTYNFSYYKGDTFEFNVYPKDSAGNAFDLTPYAALFTISTARGADGVANRVSAYTSVQSDHIKCAILPSDSASLASSTTYVYDVEINDLDATEYPLVHTILTGTITVTEQVSEAS